MIDTLSGAPEAPEQIRPTLLERARDTHGDSVRKPGQGLEEDSDSLVPPQRPEEEDARPLRQRLGLCVLVAEHLMGHDVDPALLHVERGQQLPPEPVVVDDQGVGAAVRRRNTDRAEPRAWIAGSCTAGARNARKGKEHAMKERT